MSNLKLIFLIFGTCFFSAINGSVLDYLKEAKEKSDIHKMKNIDFIYMINLDQRPEKFQRSVEQLHFYGITPYRFSAVNGWELSLEVINDIGVKLTPEMDYGFMGTCYLLHGDLEPHHEFIQNIGRTYFCHCMSRGAIGIVLSHLSILKDAYDAGYETIWVMEDDIQVIKDPHILSELIEHLDSTIGHNRWDVLFTDRDTRNSMGNYEFATGMARRPNYKPTNMCNLSVNKNVNRMFRRIGARFGAYSMIIRRTGMKKILKFYEQYDIFFPYDMDYHLPEGIRLYTVLDEIVISAPNFISDNGGPNYLNDSHL